MNNTLVLFDCDGMMVDSQTKQIRKDKRGEVGGKPAKAGKATHKKNMPHKAKVKTGLKKTGPKSSAKKKR